VPERHTHVLNLHANVGSLGDHAMAFRLQTEKTFMPSRTRSIQFLETTK
jgi:hypothetical protein